MAEKRQTNAAVEAIIKTQSSTNISISEQSLLAGDIIANLLLTDTGVIITDSDSTLLGGNSFLLRNLSFHREADGHICRGGRHLHHQYLRGDRVARVGRAWWC